MLLIKKAITNRIFSFLHKKRDSHQLENLYDAERTGFEPANRFCRLHAFQACLFNHSSTFPCLIEMTDNEGLPDLAVAKLQQKIGLCKFFRNIMQKTQSLFYLNGRQHCVFFISTTVRTLPSTLKRTSFPAYSMP